MASFRSGVQIISHISKNQECQLRNLRSYSKDRFSVKCCQEEEGQVEKCLKPRSTKSWLSWFKKREPSTSEDGESKPPKRSTSWLAFWRQPEIDATPIPPRHTCRLELERRRYEGELYALKEGRTPHAWEPDVMVITEECHDPIVCHSLTEAYPHQPPRPHPNRLARCRSSERRQTRYKGARLQETKPEEEWRHIKDQGAFYMAVRTECPRREDPPAGHSRRTCSEYKGTEMHNSRLSWCEVVNNIEMDHVTEFPKPKTYDPTPRESKGAVIPECTLRKDGTSSPLATQGRFQEPVHVSREVSTLQTRTCGGVRKVPTKEYREEVNDTRLQEIPRGWEDASSEGIEHNAEQYPEYRVEPTKTPDVMEVSENVCDQDKNSPNRVEKTLISEEEKDHTRTTSGNCLSSYLKNKEGKPNVCTHKLCVEECAPRAFPTERGCDSFDLKEKCTEDSRRVVPPTNDPESMIADPEARVKCDLSKTSPDDSKNPRGRNFSTLSSSPAFSLDHHSTMPLIRNSCRSVVCKMMHTSTKTNTCVSSVFREKDQRRCDKPLDSDPVQSGTKKLDLHVCEKQSAGSVDISTSGKCGKEGKPNLVCSKKKNGETKQRSGSEIAVNVLECEDRPSKKVKNLLSKNFATVSSTKFEDNNIRLKKVADCQKVEKMMPPPACFENHKQHKFPEERKLKECLEERKLKECQKVEIQVSPPSCKGKENPKISSLQKSTEICDSKKTSKNSMNSTTKMRKCKKGGKKAISHSSFSIYSLDNTFITQLKFQGYCRNMSSDEQSRMPILKNQSFRNEEDSKVFYGSLPTQFTKYSFNGSRIPDPIEYLKTRQPERKVPDFNFDHTTFLRKPNYTPEPGKKFLHTSSLRLKSKDSKNTGKKEGKKAPCKKKQLEMKEPEPLDCPAVILPGCPQPGSIACSRERKLEHVSECHRIPNPTISYSECVKDPPPTPIPSECDCLSNASKWNLMCSEYQLKHSYNYCDKSVQMKEDVCAVAKKNKEAEKNKQVVDKVKEPGKAQVRDEDVCARACLSKKSSPKTETAHVSDTETINTPKTEAAQMSKTEKDVSKKSEGKVDKHSPIDNPICHEKKPCDKVTKKTSNSFKNPMKCGPNSCFLNYSLDMHCPSKRYFSDNALHTTSRLAMVDQMVPKLCLNMFHDNMHSDNKAKSSLSGYYSFNSNPLIYSGKATLNKASANMVVHERQVGLSKRQSLPKVITSIKSNVQFVRVYPLKTEECQPTIRTISKRQVKRKCEEVRLKTRPSKVQDETGLSTKEKVMCNQITAPELHIKSNEEEKVTQVLISDEKQNKLENTTESHKTQIFIPNVTQISNATETTFLRRMKTWFSFLVPTLGVKEAGNNNLNDSVTIHHQLHASQEREENPEKNKDDDILKYTLSEVCVNNPNKDDHSSPVAKENKNAFILAETQVDDIKPTETKFKADTAKVERFIPSRNVQNGEKRIKSEQNKVSVSQNTIESLKLHALNTGKNKTNEQLLSHLANSYVNPQSRLFTLEHVASSNRSNGPKDFDTAIGKPISAQKCSTPTNDQGGYLNTRKGSLSSCLCNSRIPEQVCDVITSSGEPKQVHAPQRTIGIEAENASAKQGDSLKKTKGNIERATTSPPLKQETFNPLSDKTGEQIVQRITATPTHRQNIFNQISYRQGHIYKKRVKSTGQTEREALDSKNDVIKHQNCVWKKSSESKINAMRYISESTDCRTSDQKDPMKTKKENRCGVQVKQKRYGLQKVWSKNAFSSRLPNITGEVVKGKPSKVKLSESPRRENVGKQEITCLKNPEKNAIIHKTYNQDSCTTKEHGYSTSAVELGVVQPQSIFNKGERKRRDSPVALRDMDINLLQQRDHKLNILKTGAGPEINIPLSPGYKLNVLKTVASPEINIIQPRENSLNIAATPEINVPQTPRHKLNMLKTGAGPEINIPQPPEHKLNSMKTGAGPEINIPQLLEHKLNAMKTGAGPEINIPQPPEHKLNAMKTGAGPEINIPQPPEHKLNAMKTGAGPEINIPQPPEHKLNAMKTGAGPKINIPQPPEYKLNAMKTGAGPEINIPQPPEYKLNSMKTGAGPEINIPQPPEHKLNAMKTGAGPEINIPQPPEHKLNAMKTGAGPEINIPQPPEHKLNAMKTGAGPKINIPQPPEYKLNAMKTGAGPEINIPQPPEYKLNAMKTGAGPEINIPQPPEYKLNAMKTGAGPEINIPQPPEYKLNAMKTDAGPEINIPQPPEHKLNAMKTDAGPEINTPQPPEHVLNAWKTGAKSSLPQFRFESKTNEKLKLDFPSHFYNRKFVNKTNITPDKPSRFVYKTDYSFNKESFSLSCKMRDPLTFSIDPDSYKSQDKAKPIMAKVYCDEIIESKETDKCRMKDKLSDPNIILSVNEGDENVFELTNDTKRQIKMCSEEPIQSKSSIQTNKPKSMLNKVDTLVIQEKDDTTQIKGIPKNYFKPQTTNQFLEKATNDPKKIPEFLFPESQYSKIINLNNEKLINIDNKRKLSMIMLQYKQIFEAKSFNSKGDSFGQQSGGGSKSKCNEHENHPSCKKTHVSEMMYSGKKINYSGLNTDEQNEGHIYSNSKSKTSDSTNTDEKTSRYNSHLKYQKQKLKVEIEVCGNTRARARDSEICIDKNSNMEMKVCKKTKPQHDPCLGGINNKYKTPRKIPNKKEKICKPLNYIANLETNKTQKEVEWHSKLNCVATSCNNNERGQITKPNPLTSRQTCQTNPVKQNICGEKSQVNLKDNSLENTTKIIKKRKPKHYKIEENIKYSLEKGGQGKCAKCSKIKKNLCLSCLGGKFKKPLSRKKANKKRQSSDEALDTAAENLSLCKTFFQAADKLGIVSPHQSVSSNFVRKRTVLLLYEEKLDGKSSKNKTNESPKCSKQSYKKSKDGLNGVEEPNKVSEKLTQYQKCRKTEVSPAVSIKIKEETETCPIMKASKRYRSKMKKRGLNLVPVSTGKKSSSVSYSTYSAHYTPLQFKEHDKHVTSQNNTEKSSLDRLNNERFKKDMTSLSDKLSEDLTSNSKLHEDYSEINTKQDTYTLNEEIRKCNMSSLTTIEEVTRTNLIDEINGFGKIYYSNKSGSYTQIYDIPTYSNNKLISHSLILRRSYSKYKAGDLNVPEGGSLNQFRKITEPCLQISRRMKSTDSKGDSACRFKDESNSKKGKINSASGSNNKSTKVKGIIENDPNVSSETSPCGNHLKYVEKSTSRGDANKEGAFSDQGEVKKETFSSFFKIPSWCKSKPMKVETNTPQNGPPITKTEIAKSPSDCGKPKPSPLCGICGHKNANKISPGATKSSPVNTSDTEEVCSKIKPEKLSSICVNNEASKKSSISTPACGGKETTKMDETGGLKKDLSTSSLVCGKEDSQKLDPNILRTEPKCRCPDTMTAEKLCPRIQDSIPPPSCVDKSKSTCSKVSLNSSNCKDSNAKKCSEVEYSKPLSCANRSKSTCPKLEMSKCKDVKNNTELEKQTQPNIETFKHSLSNEIPNKSHTQKSKPVDTTASPTNEDKCHPKSHDAPDCKYPESPRVTCMTTRQAKQFSESKGGSCESTILCPPRKDPTPKAPVCKTHHKSLEKIIKQTALKDPPSKCGDEGTASKVAKRLERPKYEPRTPDKDKKEEKDFSARQWMEKYGHKLKKMGCPPMKPTVAEIPCEVAKKPQKFLSCKGEVMKEQPSMVNTGKEDSKKIVGEKTDMRDEKCEPDLACQQCQWGEYKLPELGPDGEVIRADEKWPFQKKGPETEN